MIEPRTFRDVLGHYPTGVALITGMTPDGEPIGMVVGSFTSVSLEPPLVAFLPTTTSYTYQLLRQSPVFVVNVLAAEQEAVCRTFASKAEDKWAGVGWTPSPGGAPILDEAVAWIECTPESEIDAGDHYIVLGRVQELAVQQAASPLLFFQGGYGRFTMSSVVAASAPDLAAAIRTAEVARPDVEDLSARLGVTVDLVASVGPDLVFIGSVTSGRAAPSGPTLGTRIPLMAPLGEQYVAWAGEDAAQTWLSRAGITDEDARAALLHRLEVARQRGWSISRLDDGDELALYDSIREYGSGDLLPAQERAVRARIVEWSERYEPIEVTPDGTYAVHSVVVPVLGRKGSPLLILRIAELPRPVTGTQVFEWVSQMQRCAAVMAARLEPGPGAGMVDVVGWG